MDRQEPGKRPRLDDLIVPDPPEDLAEGQCPECLALDGHKMDCSRSERTQLRLYATTSQDGRITTRITTTSVDAARAAFKEINRSRLVPRRRGEGSDE